MGFFLPLVGPPLEKFSGSAPASYSVKFSKLPLTVFDLHRREKANIG